MAGCEFHRAAAVLRWLHGDRIHQGVIRAIHRGCVRNAATSDGRLCLADSVGGFAVVELPDAAAVPGGFAVVELHGVAPAAEQPGVVVAAAADVAVAGLLGFVVAAPGAVLAAAQHGVVPVEELADVVVAVPGAVLAAAQHGVVPVGELADVGFAVQGVVLAAGLFGAAAAPGAVPVAVLHDVVPVAELRRAAVADPPDVPVIAEWAGVDPVAGLVDAAVAAALLPDWSPATPAELARCGLPQEAA